LKRDDPLRGLTFRQRVKKEREDADYIATSNAEIAVDPEAKTKFGNQFAGQTFDPTRLASHDWSQPVDAVICTRYDLNHPLCFPDNKFTNCADCGCDLQYRPHVPPGVKLCLCCAAERIRSEPEG